MDSSNHSEQGDSDSKKQYGISKREIDFSKSLYDDLLDGVKLDKDQFERMAKWRTAVRGKAQNDGGEDCDVDDLRSGGSNPMKYNVNLMHSRFVTMRAELIAKNPEAAISPAPRVDEESYTALRGFTRTAEIYVNHAFETGDVKRELKKAVRSTQETSIGWVKAFYQKDYWSDPLVKLRNDDAQDNIAQLQTKLQLVESGELNLTEEQINVIMAEVFQLQQGLEENDEIMINEGWTFAKLHSDDVIVSPEIDEIVDYAKAPWIAHRTFKPVQDAMSEFGLTSEEDIRRLQEAKIYNDKNQEKQAPTDAHSGKGKSSEVQSSTDGGGKDGATMEGNVCIWEMQHKQQRTVYTFIEGMKGFAKDPSRPKYSSARWYDMFMVTFNDTDKERWPLSDTELAWSIVDEYNATRQDLSEHRAKAVPARVARKGDLTPADVKAINNAVCNEMVLVDGGANMDRPISDSVAQLLYAQIDPALYDVTPLRLDLDQVLGTPDLSTGAQLGERTATAANIQNQGMESRQDTKRDEIEECIKDIAEHILQIALQRVPYQRIIEICGDGAVWPGKPPRQPSPMEIMQFQQALQNGMPAQPPVDDTQWINEIDRDSIYGLTRVEIIPGSTGKPNQQQDEQLAMQRYPVLHQALLSIWNNHYSGMAELAQAETELFKSLIRKIDDRPALEKLLPQQLQNNIGQQGQMGMMGGMQPGMGGMPGMPGMQQPGQQPGQQNPMQGGSMMQRPGISQQPASPGQPAGVPT